MILVIAYVVDIADVVATQLRLFCVLVCSPGCDSVTQDTWQVRSQCAFTNELSLPSRSSLCLQVKGKEAMGGPVV